MKTRMTMIAAAVAMMFMGTHGVLAAQQMHEDEWDKVNLYGSTSIAQDSMDDWGPWKEFIQPAAGPAAGPGVTLLGALGSELYRPLPNPTPLGEEGCAAGAWCGYVVYRSYLYTYDYDDGESSSTHNRPQAGLLTLVPSPEDPGMVTVDGGEGYGTMSFQITPMAGSDPLLVIPAIQEAMGWTVSGLPVEFGMDTTWVATRDGLANFYGSDGGEYSTTMDGDYVEGSWGTAMGGHNRIWARGKGEGDGYDVTPYMTMGGYMYVGVWGYINGNDGGESYYYGDYFSAQDGAEGYVAGIPTPLADMAALQAGNVTASYAGLTSGYKNTSYQSPVALTVNFGNGTWSGSWNNGADGNMYQTTDSAGRAYLVGQVGLNASGTVSGANFQSTSVSATDGVVSGSVQGGFYGPQAVGMGGIVNVTKSATEGYSNATYVDVFAGQKVEQPR